MLSWCRERKEQEQCTLLFFIIIRRHLPLTPVSCVLEFTTVCCWC